MRIRTPAVLALLTSLLAAGCAKAPPKLTPEQQAYVFRDVFPYPAITGDGDDTTRLKPLEDGYLVYIGAKDFPAAANAFARAAQEHPDLIEARLLQGISLVLAERPAEAVAPLEAVVKERPQYAPGRWWLGKAYFQTNRHDDAMEQMREVASLGDLYAKEARMVLDAGANPE